MGYTHFYGIALNGVESAFVYLFRELSGPKTGKKFKDFLLSLVTKIKITGSSLSHEYATCETALTQKSVIEFMKDPSKLKWSKNMF
jgi:hypothetical protein